MVVAGGAAVAVRTAAEGGGGGAVQMLVFSPLHWCGYWIEYVDNVVLCGRYSVDTR